MFSLTMVKNWAFIFRAGNRYNKSHKSEWTCRLFSLRTCETAGSVSDARLTAVDTVRGKEERIPLNKQTPPTPVQHMLWHLSLYIPFQMLMLQRNDWKKKTKTKKNKVTHRTLARGCWRVVLSDFEGKSWYNSNLAYFHTWADPCAVLMMTTKGSLSSIWNE